MRAIKFRAWIKRKNELIYLRGFRYSGNEKIKITFADKDKDDCTYTFLNKDVYLEQFTGLHDKNGVEVYEGDTVRIENQNGEFDDFIIYAYGNTLCLDCGSHCGLDCDIFTLDFLSYGDDYESIEVIGNIHERRMGNNDK